MASLQCELKILKKRVDQNEDKLEQTSEKLGYLETSVSEENTRNVYAFADLCERQDYQSNLSKSHCVLLTGRFNFITTRSNDEISY